jgi:hypothetical protein
MSSIIHDLATKGARKNSDGLKRLARFLGVPVTDGMRPFDVAQLVVRQEKNRVKKEQGTKATDVPVRRLY